jgi:uncharacterized protein
MTAITKLLLALGTMLAVQASHAGAIAPDVLRSADRSAEQVSRDHQASYQTKLAAYDQAQTQRPDDAPLALARCAFIHPFAWAEYLAWADARAFAFLVLLALVAGWLVRKTRGLAMPAMRFSSRS